ncbi:probable serine/threonine-protein kinase tsuA [Anopheles marshallii]|uniref:probable serine/threonine-protein kinase tsuA n=1 Tax=Anopheles marshallii TaxID=1521116 RepID=UPI00237BFDCD|nr:probable serine/threonine-protein kinase tsuA [Anopheles marshallii]
MAAMVNMTNLLNGKDSRWLQLEVCREYQRNKCSRPDTECKFAHPPANVEVQNGRVTACYDSIKGRCNREKPPCKYFHPPQHLKDQLLINGRNHLALKNALMQQMGISPGQPVLPGQVPAVNGATVATTVATAVPPAAAAALGFTLAWGTAPPPPYTTYVVSHSPSAVVTHHNGNAPPPTNGVTHCNGTSGIGSTNTTTNGSSTVNGHSHSAPGNNNNSNHCNSNSNNNNNNTTTTCKATNPYLASMPASTYSPYFQPGHLVPTLLGPVSDPSSVSQLGPVVQQAVVSTQQKIPRSDRLEVCREFMRGACKRAESECRFAHPQESVTTHEDGSVTVCMDAVKGRCAREPCRYFHPPLHLQAQIKAAQSRATATAPVSAAAAVAAAAAAAAATMGPLQPPPPPPGAVTSTSQLSISGGQSPLEVGKKRAADSDMIQMMDMKTMGSIYYENFAFPGMVPFKRTAGEKSGIPVYQPGATYQQLMQLQQPFVPVSCEYPSTTSSAATYIPPASTATPIANNLASLVNSNSSNSSSGSGGGGGGGSSAALAAAIAASSAGYNPSSMLLGGLYYTTSGAGGTNAIVTSVGGTGGWAGSSTSVASMLNNNSPKMSNKNAPLAKSLSLQSMASLGGSMNHLAGASNGQAANAHSEGDLKEAGVEKEDSLAGDLLTPSSGALSSSATTTTTAGSGASLAQTLATSSTQAVSVPVTSPLMQYSAVATSNHQAASMQAHLQAAQVAAAQHAHAVHAQAAANQNAVLAAAAAAATAQYPAAAGAHYTDAASMAKEVAHKNYALKLHGGSTALTGKPLTALGYTGVALNKGGLLPQPSQQYAAAAAAAAAASATNAATAAYPQAAARLSTPTVAVAAATPQQTLLAPSLTTRPPPPIMSQPGAYPQFLRPQMPAAFGSNPYAAAAVAQQQLMNQSFMYPGAAFSAAAAAAAAAATGGYQFPMAQAGIPSNLTAIPTPVPQVSGTPAAGSAVVLNPYKKMKTS